jgi:hypothetical protein
LQSGRVSVLFFTETPRRFLPSIFERWPWISITVISS